MAKFLFWGSAGLAMVMFVLAIYNAINNHPYIAMMDAACVVLNIHTMYNNKEDI